MTSPSALLPTNDPRQIIGCDFSSGPDETAFVLCSIDADGKFRAGPLDVDGLARVTVEGIVPHAPSRPFEPNRFSKSRGRI
ncbi:hypothetical protein [Agrobacterium sp. DE0009]|uniref:hypothetical protein n=1 Tax=Agrobacterium sp. DE0009 TaxID=2587505 RepID=UPI0011A5F2F2|nr:hypothetical protein [Agrobacterium sp. DE0009]